MRFGITIRRALLLVGTTLLACRGAVDPPSTDGDLSATIGASAFTATTVFAGLEDRAFTLSAIEENGEGQRSITITLRGVGEPGTYNLAASGNAGSYVEAGEDVTLSWLCTTHQGEGSVVITELSSTRVVGTFSFAAPALITTGAMGTRVISSGAFDVRPWRE
jgi:hypothetical protein